MKLASFNINDVNRRLTNLLNWLRQVADKLFTRQHERSFTDSSCSQEPPIWQSGRPTHAAKNQWQRKPDRNFVCETN